jgi:hypothetical protein
MNGAVLIVFTIKTAPFVCVCPVYVKFSEQALSKCNIISPEWRMCKQVLPLKSTHSHQECEAKVLEQFLHTVRGK